MQPEEFIRHHTVVARPFLCPEIELHLITEACPLWSATEPDLARIGSIMATHALEGAQKSMRDGKISGERVAEFWTTFVQAGWKAVGAKYGKAPK